MRPKSYRAKKRDGRAVEVSLVNPETRVWEVVVAEPLSTELAAELKRMGATPTQEQLENRAKHWSELKGYFNMIGYNPANKLGQAKIDSINTLIGANSAEATAENMDAAIALLTSAYSF